MKQVFKFILIFIIYMGVSSCDKLDEGLKDPNNVGLDDVDAELLMNKIQAEFGEFINEVNDVTLRLVRMQAMTGGVNYETAYSPQSFNDMWRVAYRDVLGQIETLTDFAEEKELLAYKGVAQVLQAYTYVTLVDLFGDVPFSDAFDIENFNPKADADQDVYAAAMTLLDDAISTLDSASGNEISRDIFYDGDPKKWITLAKTIQLKMWLNMSLTNVSGATAAIDALLKENDLIDKDNEEFTYKYGTADVPSRARHPLYVTHYQPEQGDATGYLGTYFMWLVYTGRTGDAGRVEDPRWRYYFYRPIGSLQRALSDEPESIQCLSTPIPNHYNVDGSPFCAFEPGFFGRDHGNDDGIPPDVQDRTRYGVYPAAGNLDVSNTVQAGNPNAFRNLINVGDGGNGAGIHPLFMASFLDFMKAEYYIRVKNDNNKAKSSLLAGVRKSIDRSESFSNSLGLTLPAALVVDKEAYISAVGDDYDDAPATGNKGKLDVIGTEFYIALFGNGLEAYNMYRRTGKPDNIQKTRDPKSGLFYRTLSYPANSVNNNGSMEQKADNSVKVFWDNNPDGFVD